MLSEAPPTKGHMSCYCNSVAVTAGSCSPQPRGASGGWGCSGSRACPQSPTVSRLSHSNSVFHTCVSMATVGGRGWAKLKHIGQMRLYLKLLFTNYKLQW